MQDMAVRQFLLTNMLSKGPHQPFYFRVPLDTIQSSINDLGDFPIEPTGPGGGATWSGRTFFLRGTKSRYIGNRGATLAKEFFPEMKLLDLPTGHWREPSFHYSPSLRISTDLRFLLSSRRAAWAVCERGISLYFRPKL